MNHSEIHRVGYPAWFRNIALRERFIILLVLFAFFVGGVTATFYFGMLNLASNNILAAQQIMLQGQKEKLLISTKALAHAISASIKNINDNTSRINLIRQMVDRFRYEQDNSGYYFVYEGTTNIALPPAKDKQGKDLGNAKDKNGVSYVREMARKAQEGGGFVEYIFPKPKHGDQPKLAYAVMIPDTSFWIGTGVYLDNIEKSKATIHTENMDRIESLLWRILIGISIGLVVLIGACLLIIRSVATPIRQATEAATRCAAGDLNTKLIVIGRDEIARMQTAINTMVATLRDNIDSIELKTREAEEKARAAESSRQQAEEAMSRAEAARAEGLLHAAKKLGGVVGIVSSASTQLAAQIVQSTKVAEDQSHRLAETATAMEEMNATVLEVAKNASNAAATSETARNKANDGANVVGRMVDRISHIRNQTQTLKEDMGHLGVQAQDIGRIMNVISDIADQTNLLALNAAIEAARAGEAGRGFAVVADEVRKLAEKTMTATKEVGEAIHGIQDGTRQNVKSVDQAADSVEEASTLAGDAGQVLASIVALVENTSDQVRAIATAAEEQSSTSEEINRTIEDVNNLATTASRGMSEASVAVDALAQQAQELALLTQELESEGHTTQTKALGK